MLVFELGFDKKGRGRREMKRMYKGIGAHKEKRNGSEKKNVRAT